MRKSVEGLKNKESTEPNEFMNLRAIKINTLVALLSILTSICLCAVFIFNSGSWKAEMSTRVQSLETQMSEVALKGSPNLAVHMAEDSREAESVRQQIQLLREEMHRRLELNEKKIEAINIFQVTVATLNGRLETMDAKLDSMRKALEENTKATAEIMKDHRSFGNTPSK